MLTLLNDVKFVRIVDLLRLYILSFCCGWWPFDNL